MSAILTALSSLATSMISIWGSVITFITTEANIICLIPLLAWLFVLACSTIRRFYKG